VDDITLAVWKKARRRCDARRPVRQQEADREGAERSRGDVDAQS
jgi:hypothetical protein